MRRAKVLVLLALGALAASACGEAGSNGGSGDTVVDDTRPQPRPPPNPDEGTDASTDGPAYGEGGGSPQLGACDTCACTPDQFYCFGGGSLRARSIEPFAKDASDEASTCSVPDAAAGDGGDPGLSPEIGCNVLPKGCADCGCIIAALQPKYACYLVCAFDGNQMLVYCPHL